MPKSWLNFDGEPVGIFTQPVSSYKFKKEALTHSKHTIQIIPTCQRPWDPHPCYKVNAFYLKNLPLVQCLALWCRQFNTEKYICLQSHVSSTPQLMYISHTILFLSEMWYVMGAACSVVVKLLDLDPQEQWFDPWCGHDKICKAVGPLSKALNPTLLLLNSQVYSIAWCR